MVTFSFLKLNLLQHGSNPKSIVNSSTYSKFFWRSEGNGGSLQGSACRMRSSYHSLNKNNMNAYPLKKVKKTQ